MTRLFPYLVGAVVGAAILWGTVACHSLSPPPTPTVDPALVARARAASDVLANIAMTPDPDPPVVNREVTLRIRVSDRQGQGTWGQPVSVQAQPAGDPRGRVEVPAGDAGGGSYLAKLTPTSPGPWTVVVVARAGGFVRTESFTLNVRPAP